MAPYTSQYKVGFLITLRKLFGLKPIFKEKGEEACYLTNSPVSKW
jgi:hypothetical protein